MNPNRLLSRLEEIGRSLERSGHALALIGLGSVGQELDRLDEFSDLDFFAVVEPGYRQAYLDDLSWLSRLCPIAYAFANTRDGYKLLFADEVFCEFAVFEPHDLEAIPFAPGRIVWKRPDVPTSLSQPAKKPEARAPRSPDWLLGEALTNLYVGLARARRGERLSAARFIQGYAVDRVIELADQLQPPAAGLDAFAPERRFEQRHPELAGRIAGWMQGYNRNRESALAILAFLEEHFEVNPAMAASIRKLAVESDPGGKPNA